MGKPGSADEWEQKKNALSSLRAVIFEKDFDEMQPVKGGKCPPCYRYGGSAIVVGDAKGGKKNFFFRQNRDSVAMKTKGVAIRL